MREQEPIEKTYPEIAPVKQAWPPDLELPADSQWLIWLRICAGDVKPIRFALQQTARRHAKSALNPDHAIRFLSAAMNRFRFKSGNQTKPSLPDAKFFAADRRAA
jgi:hypothetical protein